MPRGYPDYQNPVNQVAGRLVDFSGIQSAILGLATLDGLGRLLWFDTFRGGLGAWELVSGGPGADPSISDQHAEIPPTCLKLDLGAGGAGSSSQISRTFIYTRPSIFGVELGLLLQHKHDMLTVTVTSFFGGVILEAVLEYDQWSGVVTLNLGFGALPILTVSNPDLSVTWLPLKLVLDFQNGVGRRLVVGSTVLSLADKTFNPGAGTGSDLVFMAIAGRGLATPSASQYVGHVYLTTDEP